MTLRICCMFGILAALTPFSPAMADGVEIREWLLPWKNSEPGSPRVDSSGRVWFVGQKGNFIGNLNPGDGSFNRYDLRPKAEPASLVVDDDRNIWFTANRGRYIGKLSPATGQIEEFAMPDRDARDPYLLTFDLQGNLWFTVSDGNFIGRVSRDSGAVDLISVDSRKSVPEGIVVDNRNIPWAAASGRGRLLQITPATLTITEISLPDEDSSPRQVVTTSKGEIFYTDFELGRLGSFSPASGDFDSWPMPGGEDSRPHGMAIDKYDRIWTVETGSNPGRIVGFDSQSKLFINQTNIPSGGGDIRQLYYDESAGQVWFASEQNYIGRAQVH